MGQWLGQAHARGQNQEAVWRWLPTQGPQGHWDPVPSAHNPPALVMRQAWAARDRLGPHLDGPLQLGPLVAKPQHPDDGQGHTEPVEEAEEVDDRQDVAGEGVQQGHDTLQAERWGNVSPPRAWASTGSGTATDDGGRPDAGRRLLGELTVLTHSCFKGDTV